MANVVVLAVALACSAYGIHLVARPQRVVWPPAAFIVGAIAIIFLSIVTSDLGMDIGRRLMNVGKGKEVRRETAGAPEKLVKSGLYLITIGSFLTIGVLVHQTDGFFRSPFGQIAPALVVLAPYLMTEWYTKVLNFLLGSGFLAALIALAPEDTSTRAYTVDRWVYYVITLSIVAISLGFYAVRSAREGKEK